MTGPERGPRPVAQSVATLGMALCGPVAFFTGLWVFATLWAGTPAALLVVFAVSATGTVFFTLIHAAADARRRSR